MAPGRNRPDAPRTMCRVTAETAEIPSDLSGFTVHLFDLDGVITPTAEVHMTAWDRMFEDFLTSRGVAEPYTDADYFAHVDGRPRYDGVRAFLASRGITLPEGEDSDPGDQPAGEETVRGLGNRKNHLVLTLLRPRASSLSGDRHLSSTRCLTGHARPSSPSSRNAEEVLRGRRPARPLRTHRRRQRRRARGTARQTRSGHLPPRRPSDGRRGLRCGGLRGRRLRRPGRSRRHLRCRHRRGPRRRAAEPSRPPAPPGRRRIWRRSHDPPAVGARPTPSTAPIFPWTNGGSSNPDPAPTWDPEETLFATANGYLGMRGTP